MPFINTEGGKIKVRVNGKWQGKAGIKRIDKAKLR